MARIFRSVVIALLCLSMSHVPEAAAIGAIESGMISTSDAVDMLSRDVLEANVRTHLDREELKVELLKYGVSAEEVSSRLATLSNQELNHLALQMDQALYGGDSVSGILIIVLLVLLIIYLAKRI